MSQSSISFRKAPGGPARGGARCQRRQPVAGVPARTAPQMRELDHHGGAVLVAGVGQVLHPADHFVLVGQDVVEGRRAVARDDGRPSRHGQRHTAARPLLMVGSIAPLRHPVLGIGRLVAGDHQPVLQRQMLERVRLQQRVVLHVKAPWIPVPGCSSSHDPRVTGHVAATIFRRPSASRPWTGVVGRVNSIHLRCPHRRARPDRHFSIRASP